LTLSYFYLNQSVCNRCTRLKKENAELKYQSAAPHESQQQMELLKQMVRASEDALVKERTKNTNKRTDDYRVLNDQVESLKTSERQLKSKVRSLTNEIALLKRRFVFYFRNQSSTNKNSLIFQ